MQYEVRVLSVGESLIAGPEVFWMSHWDETLPLAFNVTLIRGNGITALVNASPPDDTASVREGFPTMRYLHDEPYGDLRRGPEHYMTGALASVGLEPDDITHVLLTPLELYTTGTLDKFRKAQICIANAVGSTSTRLMIIPTTSAGDRFRSMFWSIWSPTAGIGSRSSRMRTR